MNILFARFVVMLLMAAGIAWIALGGDVVGEALAHSAETPAACAVEGAAGPPEATLAREKAAARGGRSALRWQSFLPGTFR